MEGGFDGHLLKYANFRAKYFSIIKSLLHSLTVYTDTTSYNPESWVNPIKLG